MTTRPPLYNRTEELANTITHALGIPLSLGALTLMVVFSALNGNAYHIVGCSIFGSSLLFTYTMSTMYHWVQRPKLKQIFRALDHSSIFILIAGTYTPLTLATLRGGWGWTLFGLIWGLATIGIIFDGFYGQRAKKLTLTLYLTMGWLVIVAAVPLIKNLDAGGLLFLLSGGLAYTFGVMFYVWKSLFLHHMIWHLFVLAGSTLHFFAIFLYVIPN